MTVRLICGSPASGKTTYVSKHKAAGDTVIDLDALERATNSRDAAKIARRALESESHALDTPVWVIRTLARAEDRTDAATRLGADEVIVLSTPPDVAKRLSQARGDDPRISDVIDSWWENYSPADGERIEMPDMGSTTRQGEAMSKENGFPENTPTSEMSGEEREAYWKFQSRKHETRLRNLGDIEQLKLDAEKGRTFDEQKIRNEAKAEAMGELLPDLVAASFRENKGNVPETFLSTYLEDIDPLAFVGDDGKVDVEAIKGRMSTMGEGFAPSSHGGFRQNEGASGVSAGAAMFDSENS